MIFTKRGVSYRVDEDGELFRWSDVRGWVWIGLAGCDYPYLSDYQ